MRNKIAILASILIVGSASAFAAFADSPNQSVIAVMIIKNSTSQPMIVKSATNTLGSQGWDTAPTDIKANSQGYYGFYIGNNPKGTYNATVQYEVNNSVCTIEMSTKYSKVNNQLGDPSVTKYSCSGGSYTLPKPTKTDAYKIVDFQTELVS